MISASPAWKPQAMLTDVASSIMAASLPISHGPKLSPRSQFRSMVMMASGFVGKLILEFTLPCPRVHRTDGGARDIGALQRIQIENGSLKIGDPVGQGT